VDGLAPLELVIVILFAILFAWIAASFWLACFGLLTRLDGTALLPLPAGRQQSEARTAILMPVYNEDVGQAFARLQAICESLNGVPGFDVYILSDSTDPAHWIAEELAWQTLRDAVPGMGIFYRHRNRNVGRKSGNIQDFCENWGSLYDYMVVLDADSLMQGATLRALVRLMDANPRAALIQTQVTLAGRVSLFARLLQFSSSIYGPVYAAGLASLQGPDGNYWGHNAIIRVRAFMAHCGLPRLKGRPPFGGEIMSHDFIEAAFLRRAGWQVWMAPDLEGSYEEPPPTIHDFLKRDRRWCQGNLQHLKVIFAQGLRMPSRLHLAMGIMSYLSSPLWLLLLLVSAAAMLHDRPSALATYIGTLPSLSLSISHTTELVTLAGATLALLYAPKLMGLMALLRRPGALTAHGGRGAVLTGVVLESLFSTLFAPIVMLQQSWYVAMIVMGISTGWPAQQRQDRPLPLGFVVRHFALHMLIGLGAGWLLWRAMPHGFGWFVPLLAGMVLAIPLVYLTSSLELGMWFRRRGLFVTPSESAPPPLLVRAHDLASTARLPPDLPRRLLDDAGLMALHLRLLEQNPTPPPDRPALTRLVEDARARRTRDFSKADWTQLLSDPESLKTLAAP
jgi:membrane glycosyltransferase